MVSKLSILRSKLGHHYQIFMTQSITIIDISKKKSFKVSMVSFRIGESREVVHKTDRPKIV